MHVKIHNILNLRNYSFAEKNNLDDLVSLFNEQVSPKSHPNVVTFTKKEALNQVNSRLPTKYKTAGGGT